MIILVTSSEYAPGKAEELREFIEKVISYNKAHGAKESQGLRRLIPPPGQAARLTTTITFDSLAAYEDFEVKRQADPEWQALVRDVPKFSVHNSFSRALFEVM